MNLMSATASEPQKSGVNVGDAVNQNGQRLGAKGLRTREKLMNATLQLLEETGLRELTVAQVARLANTSQATFYVYFEDALAVLLLAIQQVAHFPPSLIQELEESWVGPDGWKLARQFIAHYIEFWQQHNTLFRVRDLSADEGDEMFIQARKNWAQPFMNSLTKKIQQAQLEERIPWDIHPRQSAIAVMSLLERISSTGPETERREGLPLTALIDSATYMICAVLGISSTRQSAKD